MRICGLISGKAMAIAAFMSYAGPLIAEDWNPPEWRGQPLTVKASWEFESPPEVGPVASDPGLTQVTFSPDTLESKGDGVHTLGSEVPTLYYFTFNGESAWEYGSVGVESGRSSNLLRVQLPN